jgi:xanthine dehydrogenase accessory factor
MSETRAILEAAGQLQRAGEAFLIATVARVRGSSYRRPGARMLVTRERWIAGSVSGGCLEGDIARRGWWRTRAGAPVLVTYDGRGDDGLGAGLGVGCDGAVDVLIERAPAEGGVDPLGFMASCVGDQSRGALATVLEGGGERVRLGARAALRADGEVWSDIADPDARAVLMAECEAVLASGETRVATCLLGGTPVEVIVEAVAPPLRLFVLGGGHDAIPVVGFARALGWEVFVCQPHARLATRERFAVADAVVVAGPGEVAARVDVSARAAAVVMGHDYARDRDMLEALVGTRALYLGVLGPRRRTARMLGELGRDWRDPRIHAPVGLALGAETPEEIALAIVAEIQSVVGKANGASLRERTGEIHDRAARAHAAE